MNSIFSQPEVLFFTMLAVLFFGSIAAKLTRIPTIIALILGGILVGPDVLKILPLNSITEGFATIGLIYLMFNVGLEIDLSQFKFYRKQALTFFLLTYLIPQLSGLFVGWIFGLSLSSSILLGAIYASYTLVAYPIASQLGILKNEAVAISVVASVFSDITALFILTIVMHSQTGDFSWMRLGELTSTIIFCSVCILLIIPYLSRLFFQFYSDGKINFPFVLMMLFASSTLAQITGLHAVVGAFLGGLAVNSMVTKESRVVRQTLFTGETIFIPLFLVSIGMRLDIDNIFSSWNILLMGLTLTFAVYATKLAAAWIAAWLFNYSRPQMWTMWGLTQAQAAATLAIILVGTRAGLFSNSLLQAAIIMVLFTLITSPLLVKHYGSKLKTRRKKKKRYPLLKHILVPVNTDEFPDNTIEFASRLARYGKGKLMILNVADNANAMEIRREKLRAGPLKDPDTKIELINRVEKTTLSESILSETVESEISLIMMNWEGNGGQKGRLFTQDIDNTAWKATQPVGIVLLKNPIKSFNRVIAVIGEHMIGIKLQDEFPGIAQTISKALDLPLVIMATKHYIDRFQSKTAKLLKLNVHELIPIDEAIVDRVLNEVTKNDLILIPTMGAKDRFDKNPDLITFNIWQKSEASIVILHFD